MVARYLQVQNPSAVGDWSIENGPKAVRVANTD
jgi:hypothetical protein